MLCSNCGQALYEKANFCSECGTKVPELNMLEDNIPVTGQTHLFKKSKLFILKSLIAASAVVLFVFLFVIVYLPGSGRRRINIIGLEERYIGIINKNKLQVYQFLNDSWYNIPQKDLVLPNNFKKVIGFNNWRNYLCVGVIVHNTMQFYENRGESWNIISGADLELPGRYKDIIGLEAGIDPPGIGIGIINEHEISFYKWSGDSWEPHGKNVLLPKDYKDIYVLFAETIGVNVNNEMLFYRWSGEFWDVYDVGFFLPNGYKNVFEIRFNREQMRSNLAVNINNNKVQFYDYRNGRWLVLSGMEFFIPRF